jgi:YYY domain-containing protein
MTEALTGLLTPEPETIFWWLTVELIGVVSFPIGFVIFRFLPDRGYSFNKVLGLLLMSYLLWIGASAHIVPNARWSITLILALLGAGSVAIVLRHREEVAQFLRSRWPHLLVIEGVFTTAFLVATFLASYVPELSNGERPMNNALINAVLRSDYFPPKDPWLSGHAVAYYYFGHLEMATLTKLVAIPSRITFNLSFALLASFAVSGAFGVVYNLLVIGGRLARTAFSFGMLAAIFVTFWGNLIGPIELLAAHGIGSKAFYRLLDIHGLDQARSSSEWYPTEPFWFGRAAGFPAGIAEKQFPFWRYLGEMHAQELALPVVLMTLALALNLWRSGHVLDWRFWRDNPSLLVLSALVVGALASIHPWELPGLLFFMFLIVVISNSRQRGRLTARTVGEGLLFMLPMLLLAGALYLPYYLSSDSSVPGFATVKATQRHPQTPLAGVVTLPHHLVYMWLPFLWLIGSLLVLLLVRNRRWVASQLKIVVAGVAPLVFWAVLLASENGLGGLGEEVRERGSNWVTLAILVGSFSVACYGLLMTLNHGDGRELNDLPLIPLALTGTAMLLILGSELFYANDDNPGFLGERYNTVIKAGYQAWVLLALAAAIALYYVLRFWTVHGRRQRALRLVWVGVTAMILSTGLVFPVTATFWATNSFNNPRSLDGLTLFRRVDIAEYEAVEWLRENVEGTPVILEAPVPDYEHYGGISALTGLPTLIGAPLHQVVWRGPGQPLAGREEDANQAYTSASLAQVRRILGRYNVDYVYVGPRERQVYPQLETDKFEQFMDVVFQNAGVTIYRMRDE